MKGQGTVGPMSTELFAVGVLFFCCLVKMSTMSMRLPVVVTHYQGWCAKMLGSVCLE